MKKIILSIILLLAVLTGGFFALQKNENGNNAMVQNVKNIFTKNDTNNQRNNIGDRKNNNQVNKKNQQENTEKEQKNVQLDESAVTHEITIDFGKSEGPYKDMLGVMKSPLKQFGLEDENGVEQNYEMDLVDMYRLLGISEVRTNDDYVDNCEIYIDDNVKEIGTPKLVNPDLDYSEVCRLEGGSGSHRMIWGVNDPSGIDKIENYDFTAADKSMKMVTDAGAKIYLRLGESWLGPNDVLDAKDSAKVSANVYRHFIGDFGEIDYKPEVSVVEIHNEGDGRMFWRGSDETFFELIRESIKEIRLAQKENKNQKNVQVGAPGFVDGINRHFEEGKSIVVNMIPEVGADNLDFFSAHFFGDCTEAELIDFLDWAKTLRSNIDPLGMGKKEIHLTAWNIGAGLQCTAKLKELSEEEQAKGDVFRRPHAFSFDTGLLVLAQENIFNITHAHFYAGHGDDMTLFAPTKHGTKLILNKAIMSFMIHKDLVGTERFASVVKVKGKEVEQIVQAEAAGVTAKGFKKGNDYKVLLVNDTAETTQVKVSLENIKTQIANINQTVYLPPAQDVRVDLLDKKTGKECKPCPSKDKCEQNVCVIDKKAVMEYIKDSTQNAEILQQKDNILIVELPPFSASTLEM